MIKKTIPFRELHLLESEIEMKNIDGVIYMESKEPLQNRPDRITERLAFWAEHRPDDVFLAERISEDEWRKITFKEFFATVQNISQYLINEGLSHDRPITLLSGNSIEHALLTFAALHIGVPIAPVSPAYSLKSTDYGKLHHCIALIEPKLIFVQDGELFKNALKNLKGDFKIIASNNPLREHLSFEKVEETQVSDEVDSLHKLVSHSTIAKILFTSGSTGLPKGVINTHGNITTNWQQTIQTYPFMQESGFHILDWLPWHHTFGGNNNLGMTLYCGGSLHIDNGAPTPDGILKTVKNLKEVAPTIFYNVPKGFEELLPYLKSDQELRENLFSRLQKFFYAGASLSQHIWDAYEKLALDTIGKRIFIATALGMTEASPSAIFSTRMGMSPGDLGVPVPGLSVKLVPVSDKLEARFKGDNLTPGYWKNKKATLDAFDEEGYYKTGDAVKLLNPEDPNLGLVFDGRIAEDFKMNTGAWVSVGTLRKKLVQNSSGLLSDAVITGHDKSFLGAILILDESACRALINANNNLSLSEVTRHPVVKEAMQKMITDLRNVSTGSSTFISRAIIADFVLSIDKGEVTDKGSINQRAFLKNRNELEDMIYDEIPSKLIISV